MNDPTQHPSGGAIYFAQSECPRGERRLYTIHDTRTSNRPEQWKCVHETFSKVDHLRRLDKLNNDLRAAAIGETK